MDSNSIITIGFFGLDYTEKMKNIQEKNLNLRLYKYNKSFNCNRPYFFHFWYIVHMYVWRWGYYQIDLLPLKAQNV